jgi:predicted flap endonuclease-1-like 5' DNA nuclease
MSYPIEKIVGIGPAYGEKLGEVGIKFTKELLAAVGTPKDRDELSKKTGISKDLILKWANHCDLMRIPGLGSVEADILENIGVDTVPELAQRKPENFHAAVEEYVKKTKGRWCPDLETIHKWVFYAGNRNLFPRMLEY